VEIDENFNWFGIIHKLIHELLIKEEEIYEMNYIHVLNWLSYFYQRDEVIKRKNKNIL
jgi:hypothetical protein